MNPSVNDTTSIEARCSSQKNALRLIYNALGGDNWCRKEKWFSSEDVSEWSGVTCNPRGQITALELSQNNLQGRLDNIIEALDCLALTLEQLWLSENGLIGNLPPVLADRSRFPVLSILDVGSNQLSGSLHPAFTRAKHFSWFDVTGTNQLTSYFRHENKNSSSNTFAFTSRINSSSSSSPLVNVHVVECLLPILDCQTIIDLAVDYTQRNGGWQMDRHKDYQTTDIDVALVGGELLRLCNDLLKECILPALSQFFGFAMEDLAIEDLFMAKYSASSTNEQSSLSQHRDGSELSFVITLNEGFQGGGTKFVQENITVAPQTAGTGVLFCGRQLHAGVEVLEGTRCILAGFVRVYPSTVEAVSKLDNLIQQYSK